MPERGFTAGTVGGRLVYLDHPATSWPKPPEVGEAMGRFLRDSGANPGRSGHRLSVAAARVVLDAREAVARLLGVDDPLRVVFGANATWALNQALRGLLRPGDHVVASAMEHNAVMRPLRALEQEGVELSVVPCAGDGALDPDAVAAALGPETRLVVVNHASNVCGTLQPIAEIGKRVRDRGALLLVDAAQTAGAVPIAMEEDGIDLLAFTGHKSLLGPMGTGGLVFGRRVAADRLRPLLCGGTGSRSEREEQPEFLPDRFESGTPNAPGLAGLAAGVGWILDRGLSALREREVALTGQLLAGLAAIPGVALFGPPEAGARTATVSFRLAGLSPSEIGRRLDEEHGILCRVGLHCAPAAHRTLGTFPEGTVRFGLGAGSTAGEVAAAVAAVAALAGEAR